MRNLDNGETQKRWKDKSTCIYSQDPLDSLCSGSLRPPVPWSSDHLTIHLFIFTPRVKQLLLNLRSAPACFYNLLCLVFVDLYWQRTSQEYLRHSNRQTGSHRHEGSAKTSFEKDMNIITILCLPLSQDQTQKNTEIPEARLRNH